MRRGRIFIYLAILLIVGVGAAVFLLPMLFPSGDGGTTSPDAVPTATQVPMVEVVVVKQLIPLGTEVTAEQLLTIPIPEENYVEGLYIRANDIQQKVLGRLARYDLQQGVWLNPSFLVESLDQVAETVSELSFMIDKGKVAVSIPITRLSSVSYAPSRGDHVNVIVTLLLVDVDDQFQTKLPNYTAGVLAPGPALLLGYSQNEQTTANLNTGENVRSIAAQVVGGGSVARYGKSLVDPFLEQTFYLIPSEEQRPRLVSQTLIQDVKVLQVGTYVEKKPDVQKSTEGEAEATPVPTPAGQSEQPQATPVPERPDLITLVVSPQDAVTLNYLLYTGAQLTLALRPVGDSDIVDIQAVTLKFLLEKYNIVRPEKLDIVIEPRVDKLVQPKLPNDVVQPTPLP
jgi:pilus assembly protein CpaB